MDCLQKKGVSLWKFLIYAHNGFGIQIYGEVERKKERKIILKWGKNFFYVVLDCKIFTYLKNK